MTNHRAYKDIAAELIKYAPINTHHITRDILNEIFEHHTIQDLGSGQLIPLPKPLKSVGPVVHLRPIMLLPILRKIL